MVLSTSFCLQVHDSHPLSVKSVKSLGDKMIKEQYFTIRDFSEAVSYSRFSNCFEYPALYLLLWSLMKIFAGSGLNAGISS